MEGAEGGEGVSLLGGLGWGTCTSQFWWLLGRLESVASVAGLNLDVSKSLLPFGDVFHHLLLLQLRHVPHSSRQTGRQANN